MSRAAKAAGAPRLQRNGSMLGAESAARCRIRSGAPASTEARLWDRALDPGGTRMSNCSNSGMSDPRHYGGTPNG